MNSEDRPFSEEKLQTATRMAASDIGIELDEDALDRLSRFAVLLREANRKMNLTAITDEEGIAVRHFADSLSILPVLRKEWLSSSTGAFRMLDMGTGAGFPGIPIRIAADSLIADERAAGKIVRPLDILLMDSLAKRVRFLDEVVSTLKLTGIGSTHARAEEAARNKKTGLRESFDFVVARAVASLPVLLEYALPFTRVGGLLVAMKGQNPEMETGISEPALRILGGRIEAVDTFDLTGGMARSLIRIRKISSCPPQWPRLAGKPEKAPIL